MREGNIELNGIEYSPLTERGKRAVVVVNSGWIFAGDVSEENGRILITRAVWVFNWTSCGFSKVIEDPSNADIRPIEDVDVPTVSELFRIPVHDTWGI